MTEMQEKIKIVLDTLLSISPPVHVLGQGMREAKINNIGVAAEAIIEMIERQPVDRVRAMAALIEHNGHGGPFGSYRVPAVEMNCRVWHAGDEMECNNCGRGNCDHIRAVKLYLT